jgi:hypothetical protein
MALLILLLVFAGFAPSFYLRGIVPSPRPNLDMNALVWAHGLVLTAWILLFWVQVRLIGTGQRARHMALGSAGMAFGVIVVVICYFAGVKGIARATNPPFVSPESWSALPLFAVPMIAFLLWMGWRHRKDAAAHKRLMLGLLLGMMEPATGRLPILPPTLTDFSRQMALGLLVFAPLIWFDLKHRGRLHWATWLVAGGTTAMVVVRSLVWTTQGWQDFASSLPGA